MSPRREEAEVPRAQNDGILTKMQFRYHMVAYGGKGGGIAPPGETIYIII